MLVLDSVPAVRPLDSTRRRPVRPLDSVPPVLVLDSTHRRPVLVLDSTHRRPVRGRPIIQFCIGIDVSTLPGLRESPESTDRQARSARFLFDIAYPGLEPVGPIRGGLVS